MTRARIDTTSLKCNFGGAAAKYAPFRTYQPGFADGTGTMTVKFTRDQTALANRLLANSILRVQDGAMARLFVDTVVANGVVDLAESSYVEVPLSIEGMNFSVGTDDSPIEIDGEFQLPRSTEPPVLHRIVVTDVFGYGFGPASAGLF